MKTNNFTADTSFLFTIFCMTDNIKIKNKQKHITNNEQKHK